MMINRPAWCARIERELARFPVVGIVGSRQVGKTTLAKGLRPDAVYVDLELPSHRQQLAQPEMFLRSHAGRLVILDEIQRAPDLFPVLRGLIDEDRRPGRFLVLGSAAPALLAQSSESLAGRIAYVELPPFGLGDVAPAGADDATHDRLWVRGGYPASWLAPTDDDANAWLGAFVRTYVERDLPQLGPRVPAEQMRRFWSMLAHVHGQTWKASVPARSLAVSEPTVARWLDLLVGACLVRRLPPLHVNLSKRLVKSPRVYLRDSGVLHALLGITTRDALLGHPVAGASFEGFAIEQIMATVPPDTDAAFFRTHAGAEIDLVLTRPRGRPVGVEVKLSDAPTLSRGVHEAMADVGCERLIVVVPRGRRFPMGERIEVVPLAELVREPGSLSA